ncbi:MAG: rod shape-determining protein MreC [Prosthecobacter sp.]|uniref:rod shape-determining protein MreC n=1 Tax=Prosthecobacter sp. TaxID=1965333 RepID=UPI0025ECA1DA|nr:rod shape-determining protein MreC [Prosthecobacter sp.]MCF7786095.1 rod shape-determining protein MreC [Prosthecobacter sp.]
MKKLNILALLIFVAGLVAVFTFDTATTRQIQSRVMSLLSPFIHSSGAMDHAAESALAPQVNPVELKRENDEQRVQLERLRIIQQKYNQIIEENAKLRQLIEFKQSAPFKMTAAKVIRRSSSTWWNSLIIDKGSLDGIGTDSPVITSVGLVGKTSILAPHMTKVILLTDEMCRVSAKIEGTLEQGILGGERAALEVRPELHLRFLHRNSNINAGAGVYSSGEGGVFPENLLLGRVKRFENREISGEAVIEPAVDFSTLDYVFVIEMQVAEPTPEPATTQARAKP